jgi:hypothetical protein
VHISKDEYMTNDKDDCFDTITKSLNPTSAWRCYLQARYDDPRNADAADIAARLAKEVTNLTEPQWLALEPFYS